MPVVGDSRMPTWARTCGSSFAASLSETKCVGTLIWRENLCTLTSSWILSCQHWSAEIHGLGDGPPIADLSVRQSTSRCSCEGCHVFGIAHTSFLVLVYTASSLDCPFRNIIPHG